MNAPFGSDSFVDDDEARLERLAFWRRHALDVIADTDEEVGPRIASPLEDEERQW